MPRRLGAAILFFCNLRERELFQIRLRRCEEIFSWFQKLVNNQLRRHFTYAKSPREKYEGIIPFWHSKANFCCQNEVSGKFLFLGTMDCSPHGCCTRSNTAVNARLAVASWQKTCYA